MACVALLIFTVTFVIMSSDEDPSGETVRIGADDYLVVYGSNTYSDASLANEKNIYVKGTYVRDGAFRNCTKIQYVYFSDEVKTIGVNAFSGCTSLYYLSAPKVTSIGDNAFKDSGLESIGLGKDLTSIGTGAFDNTKRLRFVPLWNTSVTELKDNTFTNSAVRMIDLRGITKLSPTAFSGSSMDLQMVTSTQTAVVPGICRLYCDTPDFISSNGPVTGMWKLGNQVTMMLKEQLYLSVAPTSGGVDPTKYVKSVFEYRALIDVTPNVDYVVSQRQAEIRIPDGFGLETKILLNISDLPYTLPTPTLGTLTFNGWKAEGTEGYVTKVDNVMMNTWNGVVYLEPEFGSADATLDHSSISDRTDVSSLPTRLGFTYGDCYQRLPDVTGYTHVGWKVGEQVFGADEAITTYGNHTAYSIWEPTITFKLKYMESDGSELSVKDVPYNATVAVDGTLIASEADSKRFIGWSSDGENRIDSVRVTSDMSLVPVFEDRRAFKVTVNDRGSVLKEDTVYDGRTHTFTSDDPESPTQIFLGWSDGIVSGDTMTVDRDVTISSSWRDRIAYTVTYKDGRSVIDTAEALEGIRFTINIDDPVKEGKRFDGWFDERDNRFSKGDGMDVSSDITFYTGWTDLAKVTVTVTDRSTVLESGEFYEGDSYTFSRPEPTAEDMYFVCWKCAGEAVSSGQTFVLTESLVIVAEWRLPYNYTVSFDDGIGGERTYIVKEGGSVTIDFVNPVSPDGIFTGWKDSDGASYMYGDTFVPTKDLTVTAQWRDRAAYTVTFMDGETLVGTSTAREGIAYTVEQTVGPKTGFRFLGWTLDGRTVAVGDVLDIEGNTTLTASWEEIGSFTVKYMDGSYTLSEETVLEGTTVTIRTEHPVKDGSVFITWEIDGVAVADGKTIVVTSDITVTAKWRALDEYTVSFDNGTDTVIRTCKEGETLTIDVDDPASESKIFIKWTDGTGSFLKGDVISVASDMVLNAVWKDKRTFAVVFTDGYNISRTIGYEGSRFVISVDDPTKDGKIFAGWSSDGNRYSKGGSFILTSDTTLEAVWSDRPVHKITYLSDGKTVGTADVVDGDSVLIDKKLVREGYSFKGWSMDGSGTVSKLNGDSIVPRADVSLYAVWEKAPVPSTGPSDDPKPSDKVPETPKDDTPKDDVPKDDVPKDDVPKVDEEKDEDWFGFLKDGKLDRTAVAIGVGVAALVTSMLAVALRRS